MIIEKFTCGPLDTNTYVFGEKNVVVIDPSQGSFQLISDFLQKKGLKLQKIILTHSHWDHIADIALFKEKTEVPVFVHPLDAPNLEEPGADGLPNLLFLEKMTPDGFLEEDQEIHIDTHTLKVIHTPGHSVGSICFYHEKEQLLFSGDTLFKGSIGNISFPTSNPEDMWNSLKKLAKLPASTRVFPGHGPDTVLGNEEWMQNAKQIFENYQ